MDSQVRRFTYCDPRFHPLLDNVLARLPQEVRQRVLGDETLQVLADAALNRRCAIRYTFETPASAVIYLNPRLLQEADYRQIYTVAREIAGYATNEALDDETADQRLADWGFEAEVKAVRFDRAVSDSKGFISGYRWAQKQSRQYLLQHFGIYFEDWNDHGLVWGRLPAIEDMRIHGEPRSAVENLDKSAGAGEEGGISSRDAVLAGIMTAVKEIRYLEFEGAEACRIRSRTSF